MDPNETLRRIREIADRLPHTEAAEDVRPLAMNLASHVWALDEWLQRGGAMPEAWEFTDRGPRYRFEPLGPPNPAHGELPDHG